MALQTSGAISLANVQTEFGGVNQISISEYYGKAAGIPESGTISLSHFYGESNVVLTLLEVIFNASGTFTVPSGAHSMLVVLAEVVAVVGLFVLSFGWIICADLGYYFRDKIAIEKFGLSYVGGWELQEGFYGMLQDIVFGGIAIWALMN